MVAASYGELLLAKLVANELTEKHPQARIIYCVRDYATLKKLREGQDDCEVAIWPFDFIYPVARWLSLYSPDLVVFSERFRFTVFSRAAKEFNAKVALINGRAKKRKSRLYSLGQPFYRWVFDAFDAMCFQNCDYKEAAACHVVRTKLVVSGDLKMDLEPKPLSAEKEANLAAWLAHRGDLPVIAAGSTDYQDDDEIVLRAYKIVRESVDCRLLLAPRRLARKDEIIKAIGDAGLTYNCRSAQPGDADVYLLDTLGELAHAYKHTVGAYIGGALNGDGHNIMEPLLWGVPVAYGRNRGHFESMQRLAEEADLGTRVATPEDLADFWLQNLNGPDRKPEYAARAKQMLEPHRGALERTVATLSELLPPCTATQMTHSEHFIPSLSLEVTEVRVREEAVS